MTCIVRSVIESNSWFTVYTCTCIVRSVIESNSQPQEQSGESSWWRLWEVTVVTWPQWVDSRVGLTPPIYLRRKSTSPCSGFIFITDLTSHLTSVLCLLSDWFIVCFYTYRTSCCTAVTVITFSHYKYICKPSDFISFKIPASKLITYNGAVLTLLMWNCTQCCYNVNKKS